MPQVELRDVFEVLSAFTGAREQGEKFAISNQSLQEFVNYAARWLAKNPADVEPLIRQARTMRDAALEQAIEIPSPLGPPMKLIREIDANAIIAKLCDCQSYPPFP